MKTWKIGTLDCKFHIMTKLRKLDNMVTDAPVPVICGSLLRSYRDDIQWNYLVVETTERTWRFAILFFYITVRVLLYIQKYD